MILQEEELELENLKNQDVNGDLLSPSQITPTTTPTSPPAPVLPKFTKKPGNTFMNE
jgi:hypothetical protein